ncbi:hypothetical protein GCM10017710_47080 [Arthrobacter ramosus]
MSHIVRRRGKDRGRQTPMMNAKVATQPVVHSTKDVWAGSKLVTDKSAAENGV